MDAAMTARRLGATDAVAVYRRTRDKMPAHEVEVEEATDEGVRMMWLSTTAKADEGRLVIEKMALDDTGFPQPTGDFTELEADTVVLALGQEAELSLLDGVPGVRVEDGVVQVGPDLMTGPPGIFAGGDMVPAERTAEHPVLLRRPRHGAPAA
jgi:NADPH-dependent glutamate synthase beta subunit-like oxidoreductase